MWKDLIDELLLSKKLTECWNLSFGKNQFVGGI